MSDVDKKHEPKPCPSCGVEIVTPWPPGWRCPDCGARLQYTKPTTKPLSANMLPLMERLEKHVGAGWWNEEEALTRIHELEAQCTELYALKERYRLDAEKVEAALAEREAVIAKLPKTADGKPVIPDMDTAWSICWGKIDECEVYWDRAHQDFCCGMWSVSKAYSTREAAQAAALAAERP